MTILIKVLCHCMLVLLLACTSSTAKINTLDTVAVTRLSMTQLTSSKHGTNNGTTPKSYFSDSISIETPALGKAKKTVPQNLSFSDLKSELETALKTTGFMVPNPPGNYRLSIAIIQADKPSPGFKSSVNIRIKYLLKDSRDNRILFDKIIASSHTSTVDDSLLAGKREKLAKQEVIRKNISSLIRRLKDIEKTEKSSK